MSMHPKRNLFKEFPNRVFFETGSYHGDSIQLAIEAGFQTICSMDIDTEQVDLCMQRFDLGVTQLGGPTGRINVIHDDSAVNLKKYIAGFNEPITFWLDAHAQYLEDEPEFPNPYPLLAELEQISRHPIKTHTILIDDILHLTHPDVTRWSKETIEDALRSINRNYQFNYFANPVKNNILVAHL